MRKNHACLGFTLWCLSSACIAQSPDDVKAKNAFTRMDFQGVIDAYSPYSVEQLNDKALYRLAIALHKTGRSELAAVRLQAAEQKTPEGTFASSPARLAAWRGEINAAAAAEVSTDLVALKKEGPLPEPVAIANALASTAQAQPISVKRELSDVSVEPKLNLSVLPGNFLTNPSYRNWEFGLIFGSIFALLIAAVAWMNSRPGYPPGSKTPYSEVTQAHRLMQDNLDALRKNAVDITALMKAGDAEKSVLYVHLSKMLPILEREIGRARFYEDNNPKVPAWNGDGAVKMSKSLERMPLKLSEAKGSEVAAIFQSSRQSL